MGTTVEEKMTMVGRFKPAPHWQDLHREGDKHRSVSLVDVPPSSLPTPDQTAGREGVVELQVTR